MVLIITDTYFDIHGIYLLSVADIALVVPSGFHLDIESSFSLPSRRATLACAHCVLTATLARAHCVKFISPRFEVGVL